MAKRKPLWKISVTTVLEAEEAVAELLSVHFSQTAASYTDAETGVALASVYLSQPPRRFRPALRESLEQVKRCGINIGSGKISLEKIRAQDWANSWKRHFKPIEVGSRLLIKPSWSRRRPRKGQSVIVLDPGLSFGTGQHPTTGFCLEQLAARHNPAEKKSFMDMGSGSGILAIAAAKLGYAPVEAFDFDPEAVRVARENARRNRVLEKIQLRRANLMKLPRQSVRKYDLICANLISNLLISERSRILARLKPEGALILAGILNSEFAEVRKVYAGSGLDLIAARAEKEWCSGAFCFRGI
jgi:ribosomal protein L11 methyltransferase